MYIKQAIKVYLQWKETHTHSAKEKYEVRLNQFYNYISQYKTKLNELNGDDISAYHKSMQQNYSPTTIAFSARILKNFLGFWHGRREIDFSPKEIIPIRFIAADREIVTKHDFDGGVSVHGVMEAL